MGGNVTLIAHCGLGPIIAKPLSGLFYRSGGSAVLLRSSRPPWVFIPAVAYVTFTVMAALSSTLFSSWPQDFTVSLKNAAHQCTTKKQIMRWYQQGIHWPFSWCVFFLLFFTALSHSECLPERVTSHGSIFSRGELCCSMCPWWVELTLRALEKYSSW